MRKLILLLNIIFFISTGFAQVIVTLQQPPQYQFKLENMWKVILTNPTSASYSVYLEGFATESTSGLIVDATTATFTLPPGTRIVTSGDIMPISVRSSNGKYDRVVKNIGGVPTGDYEICVSVINADDGSVIGSQCIQQQVMNLTQVELLQPENGAIFSSLEALSQNSNKEETFEKRFVTGKNSFGQTSKENQKKFDPQPTDSTQKLSNEISLSKSLENASNRISIDIKDYDEKIEIVNGSFIVFNWLPPTPVDASQLITYSIKITEKFGQQSSYDALQSNPAFYRQSNIYSTIFQFPVAAREFTAGKSYAWQVNAYINGTLVSTSEVRDFTFGKNEAGLKQKKPQKQLGLPGGLSGLTNIGYSKNFKPFSNNAASPVLMNPLGDIINFSGSAKLETQTARREGFNSEVPERFTNLEIYPVLTIYGLPFSSNILLSSQQQPSKQSMNSFGLNFDLKTFQSNLLERVSAKADELAKSEELGLAELNDNLEKLDALKIQLKALEENPVNSEEIDSLKSNLAALEEANKMMGSAEEMKSKIESMRDPENLKESLDEFDLLSGTEKIFMSVQTIGFGINYPDYTPHTLRGVPVNGINIEINPAFFYLAFAGTANQKGIENTAYRRNLFAGRFGVGAKDESHFHFTGLYAKDDEHSIVVGTDNLSLTPKANYLFGIEGKLALFDDDLTLEGEAVGSMLTRDVRSADLENDAIPKFIKNLVHPKISSSVDFMYAAKASYSLEETSTKISMGMKMIGPGFTSLGVPNLRTDYFGYEGKLDQKFMKRRISLSTSFKNQRDNLIDWKSYTTTTTSVNVNLGLRFPNLPSLNFIYSPYFQKNNTSEPAKIVDNKTSLLSVMTSYSYPIMEFQSSTNLSFSLQQTKTFSGIADFSTDNFMVTQTATFITPLTFAGTFGIIHLKPAGDYSRITTFDLSASFPIFEIVQSTLGFRIALEKDKNKKFGLYGGASVSILDNYMFDVSVEQSTYSEWNFLTEYSDLVLRATIQAAW